MYQAITKYVTGDNVEHCTEKAARKHFENVTLEKISNVVDSISNTNFALGTALNASVRFKLIVALYEQRDQFRKAIEWETFGDDNIKDED